MKPLKKHALSTIQAVIALCCCAVILHTNIAMAQDFTPTYTTDDLQQSYDSTPWYNPKDGACASGTLVSGNAAEVLTKQGLDPKWVEAIVREAKNQGADPLAMATVLYWENRRFPPFEPKHAGSATIGLGPWQIIASTWTSNAAQVLPENERALSNADDPTISTKVAAFIVANYGGKAGVPLGSILQDFSKEGMKASVATFAKNYNAGPGTWRNPGVAGHGAPGDNWMQGTRGPWGGSKEKIIDDYIVASTLIYYKMAKGEKLPDGLNSDAFVQEGLAKQAEMQNFVFSQGDGSTPGNTTSTSASSCGKDAGGTAGQGDIVAAALELAWDTGGHGKDQIHAKPRYQEAMPAVVNEQGNDGWSDCGVFVSTVMRWSKSDTEYYKRGTSNQVDYARKHPDKYEVIDSIGDTSLLHPGDILVNSQHTYIFIGSAEGRNYSVVQGSWKDHVPEAGAAPYLSQKGELFVVVRKR